MAPRTAANTNSDGCSRSKRTRLMRCRYILRVWSGPDPRALDQLEASAVGVAEEDGGETVDRDLGTHVEPARPRVRDAETVELRAARALVLDQIGEPEPAEIIRLLDGLAHRRRI